MYQENISRNGSLGGVSGRGPGGAMGYRMLMG